MRQGEDEVLRASLETFRQSQEAFRARCPGGDTARYYSGLLSVDRAPKKELWYGEDRLRAEEALAGQIRPLPADGFPVVIAGGSFNSEHRRSLLREEDRAFLDAFLDRADPERTVLVVGHRLTAQEGYAVRQAEGRIPVWAIVPARLTSALAARLRRAGIHVLISIESSGMGLYKSFAYEIFNRRPSALLVFDGTTPAQNLIQEARNAKFKCWTCIHPRSRALAAKARTLEGYVSPLQDPDPILARCGILKKNRETLQEQGETK